MKQVVQASGNTPATRTYNKHSRDDESVMIARFQNGDMEVVADFLDRYGDLLRAHYRRKIGRSMRRLVDSQDLLSTIARRLCMRVKASKIRAVNTKQLWALIYRIGDGALVDRVRIIERLRSLEEVNSPFVNDLRQRLDREDTNTDADFADELNQMCQALHTDADRYILVQWLNGEPLADIAEELDMKAPMIRKRWQRIRETIRAYLLKTEQS